MKIQAPYSQNVTCPVCNKPVPISVLFDLEPTEVAAPADGQESSTVTMNTTILNATFSHSCNPEMSSNDET